MQIFLLSFCMFFFFFWLICNIFLFKKTNQFTVLLLRIEFVKRSRNLTFIFNNSNTINGLTIIYERAGFPNVFQIFNLNKDTTKGHFTSHICHAMDYHGSERKSLDLYTLGRDFEKVHLSRPSSNTIIGSSNFLSLCIFLEKQELEEKPRLATVL